MGIHHKFDFYVVHIVSNLSTTVRCDVCISFVQAVGLGYHKDQLYTSPTNDLALQLIQSCTQRKTDRNEQINEGHTFMNIVPAK